VLKGKKLVCFDLDGTLIDSVGIWNQVDAQLIQQFSQQQIDLHSIQQQRDQQLKSYKHCLDSYLEYCNFLKESYEISQLSAEQIKVQRYAISQHFLDHIVRLKPQADQYVKSLKACGIAVALTTTTSLNNVKRYAQNNQAIYSKLNFLHDFDLVLTRESVTNIKPHPEMYLKALQHFGISAAECLIVEDSLIGVEAANVAGIDVIAIQDEYSIHEATAIKQRVNYYAPHFKALLQFVDINAIHLDHKKDIYF